jgi:hypothetical protein
MSAAAGCTLLAALLLLSRSASPPETRESVGTKGGSSLRVFCRTQGTTFQLEPGDRVSAGDGLRFEVLSVEHSFLMMIALRSDGEVSIYAPFEGRQSLRIPVRKAVLLEGSITLDDSKLDELLVVLLSKVPISAIAAKAAAARALREAKGNLRVIGRLELPGEQLLRMLPRAGGHR